MSLLHDKLSKLQFDETVSLFFSFAVRFFFFNVRRHSRANEKCEPQTYGILDAEETNEKKIVSNIIIIMKYLSKSHGLGNNDCPDKNTKLIY